MVFLSITSNILFSFLFLFAGILHLVKPKIFNGFIPNQFPKKTVNYGIGVLEICLGVGLLHPKTAKLSALAVILTLIGLQGIHIWDALKPKPQIGSKPVAYVRIIVQFGLMYAAYLIYKTS